jgi:hypothetical protein
MELKSITITKELVPIEYTLDNYIATVLAHPMCPPYVRDMPYTPAPKAAVDYKVAITHVKRHLEKTIRDAPLRDTLDMLIATTPVVISTGGLKYVHEEKPVTVPLIAGFFAPDARKADILPSWVADAVAFQCTSTDAKLNPGVAGETVTPADEQTLQISEQSFTVTLPDVLGGNALINANSLYRFYKTPKINNKQNYALEVAHSQMAGNWANRTTRVARGNIPDYLRRLAIDNTIDACVLPAPVQIMQPMKVCTNDTNFYRDLTNHRNVRGSDAKAGSALTAGYYLGAMSRSLDRTLWTAIDILQMMIILDRQDLVVVDKDLKLPVLAILAANDINVYVIRASKVHSKIFTCVDTTKWTSDNRLVNAVIYESKALGTEVPVYTKKGLSGVSETNFADMFTSFVPDKGNTQIRLTHVYLRDYHSKYLQHIWPSMHVHAGHVLFANRPLHNDAAITIPKLFARATLANKYKTAFPVRRVTYGVIDKYRHQVLQGGVKLLSGANVKEEVKITFENFNEEVAELDTIEHPEVIFKSNQYSAVEIVPVTNLVTQPETKVEEDLYGPEHDIEVRDVSGHDYDDGDPEKEIPIQFDDMTDQY